jgi:hypothetical protein
VVSFLEPDRHPDGFGFDRTRQTAHTATEFVEGLIESVVDILSTQATRHEPFKLYVQRPKIGPYNFTFLRDIPISN